MMELKARFDEERNIKWANYLGAAGIHVTYGVVGLKTHCKLIMVLRQDFDGLRRYVHIGTGNYHAVTARQYSDLGLFTVDKAIGEDVTEVFNYLTTGYKPKRSYRKLLVAPKAMQRSILEKIEREIEIHSEESPGLIQFKANALEDPQTVRALYRASQAGVKVDLIMRDTCRLRPQVPGLSDNIRVVSVVGRFLEHARILYFKNGGDEEYFIGSADLMSRNLRSRVEVLTPVEDEELQGKLRFLLDTQLHDRRSAWEMQADGSYIQLQPGSKDEEASGSQETLIRWTEKAHKEATRLKKRRTRVVTSSDLQSRR
jgi:polyphosphate kinase